MPARPGLLKMDTPLNAEEGSMELWTVLFSDWRGILSFIVIIAMVLAYFTVVIRKSHQDTKA